MASVQTLTDYGIPTPTDFPFAESYFPRIQRSVTFLKAHPHRKEILESGVDQTIKLCKTYPSLSFLLVSKESLKSKLVHIFKQFFFADDKELCDNDLIAFYLQKEHELIVKLSHGNYVISLFGFFLLLKEFSEFVEHCAALETFQRIEKETLGDAAEGSVFKDLRFKGFNFEFFLATKVFVSRLLRLKGELGAVELFRQHLLFDYLDQFHNFKGIKQLFSFKPSIETPKFILKHIRAYSIFKSGTPDIDKDIESANSDDIFSIEKLVLNLSNQNTSEKLQPELVSELIRSPTEGQQEQLIQLFARKLFEHPMIEKQCVDLAKDNLRFFTFPTIEGKHRLSIFHKDYCIKRVQSLNPKQASFRLLQRILKTYHKKLILLEQLHINTRQNFQEFLRDFLYKGCAVPEEKFADQSEPVKKLNRRWNKAFLKATDTMSETFLTFYTSFIFEEAIRKAFTENTQDVSSEIKETLFMQNLPSVLKVNTPPNLDRALCLKSSDKVVVVELHREANNVQFTFFKGLRKKKEIVFAISRIDHELKDVELTNDEPLTNVFADFAPSCVLIIANSKESYYLRNKMGVLVSKTAGEPKAFETKVQAFVYFYNEPLAETLSVHRGGPEESKSQAVLFYNMVVQCPMLAMLSLFSSALLTGHNPLFKSGKRVLDNDFMLFVVKMIMKEYLFENGVLCSDLFNPSIGKTLQTLLGICTAEEINEIRRASELYNKEELFKSPVLGANARSMLAFLKLDAPTPDVVDFNTMKVPIHKAHEYLSIINHLHGLNYSDILVLRDNANRILYKSPSDDYAKDIAILESICGKESFMNKVVFLKNAINDIFPKLNSKFQNIQRKSMSSFFEEKLLNTLFQTRKCNIKPGCIIEFKIKDIDLKMIRGKIGEHFSGLLMLENIGSKGRTKIQEGELDRFFSKHEVIKGVVKKVFPSILRVDVSIADQDIANVRNYLSKFNVLKNYGLENNINFVIDNEKDVPTIPLFAMHERNFDFVDYSHPKVLNINLRDAKNILREGKKIDFVMKPSPRLQKSSLDLIVFFPKHELFDILPIKCGFGGEEEVNGVISLNHIQESHPDKMTFTFDKFSFAGINEFTTRFINMLIVNLTTIYSDESYTSLTKSLIIQTLQNKRINSSQVQADPTAMVIEGDEPKENFFYFISKGTFKPLTFKLYYTDKNGEANSKTLDVNHEGFVFTGRNYVTLNFLIKDLIQKHKQEEFLHKCGDDNVSVKSFLTEIIDSGSNISIVSGDVQVNFANNRRNEQNNDNGNNNGNRFNNFNNNDRPPRTNFRDNSTGNNNNNDTGNSNNFNRRDGDSNARGFGGQRGAPRDFGNRGNNNNAEGNGNFRGGQSNQEPSKPIQAPASFIDTAPSWGGGGSDAPAPEAFAPISWGNSQNTGTEAQLTVTDSWGANANNNTTPAPPKEAEKPAPARVESTGWGGAPTTETPSWGGVPSNDTPAWGGDSKPTTADNNANNSGLGGGGSSWGQSQNTSSNDNGGESRGFGNRGGDRGGRGFGNNRGGRGGNDDNRERSFGGDRGFNRDRGDNNNSNRGEGGNFENRGRGGFNRSNDNNNDNGERRGQWGGQNRSFGDSNNESAPTNSWGGGNSNENNNSDNRGRGRGGGDTRGGYRGRGGESNDGGFRGRGRDFADRGRGENRGERFGGNNNNTNTNTTTFEAPAPSWGQTNTETTEVAPSWGNTTNTTEAVSGWGQPTVSVPSTNSFTAPSPKARSQSNTNEAPSWGANNNQGKSPDRSKAPSMGWGAEANSQIPKSPRSPAKPSSWGADPNPTQPTTNTGGWGANDNTTADNNAKATPSFANTWGNGGGSQTVDVPSNDTGNQSGWGNSNNSNRGGNDQGGDRFGQSRGGGRGFSDRGGRGGFADRGDRGGRGRGSYGDNNNRPSFSRQQDDDSNNNNNGGSRGRFNDNNNEGGYRGGFNNRRDNDNNNSGEKRGGFGDYRGRGRGQDGGEGFRGRGRGGEDRDFGDRGGFRGRGGENRGRGRGDSFGQNRGRGGFDNENTNTSGGGWGSSVNKQDDNKGFGGASWGNNETRSPSNKGNQWKADTGNNGWGNPSGEKKAESNGGGWGTPKHEPGKRGIDSFMGDKPNAPEAFSGQKRTKEEGPLTPRGERSNPTAWKPPSNHGSPRNPPSNNNSNNGGGWGASGW